MGGCRLQKRVMAELPVINHTAMSHRHRGGKHSLIFFQTARCIKAVTARPRVTTGAL